MCCWFGPRVSSGQTEKRPPDPSLFLFLSGARGLCYALIHLFLQQQRGLAVSAYKLQYTGARGKGGEQGNGLGWAGSDWRRAFWERERLSRTLSWVDHGPPAFGHFFIFFEFLDNKRKGEKQTESGSFSSSCGFWAGIALRTFVCDVGLLFCRVVRLDEMPNQSLVLGLLLCFFALPALLPPFCFQLLFLGLCLLTPCVLVS